MCYSLSVLLCSSCKEVPGHQFLDLRRKYCRTTAGEKKKNGCNGHFQRHTNLKGRTYECSVQIPIFFPLTSNMVNRKMHEQGHESCFVNKFRKLWNLPGKSFQGVLSSIFASFTAVMSICLNDGSMRLGSGMTPVFLKISLVLRTISTCSLVDSLSVIHSSTPSKPVSYPTTRRAKYPQVIRIVV